MISKLLERDLSKRIGVKDINEIKKHDFFKKLNWSNLARKKVRAPRELFINEQDDEHFEPISLEKRGTINLEESDYGEDNKLMNRVSNFTFARDPKMVENLWNLSDFPAKKLF